jgi:hypothetical protein
MRAIFGCKTSRFANRCVFVAAGQINSIKFQKKHEIQPGSFMTDLHVLAQRVPSPEYLAGLERQEVLLMLSNDETKNLLEAMLAEILGRPLRRERDRPDIAGGMMLNMLLASLTGLTLYAPDVFPDWLRERAATFTAEFMRIV